MVRPLVLVVALLLGSACTEPAGCETDADCTGGLVCIEQRCRAVSLRDGGSDAGSIDAGRRDDAGPRDAGGRDAGPPECLTGGDAAQCGDGLECQPLSSADACRVGAAGRCVEPSRGVECGCDGWSYASGASRIEARVELAHLGFCTCSECATGGLCDRGFTCGDAEVEGVCVQPPGSCDTDGPGDRGWLCGGSLEPLWENDCQRLMAGVESASPVPVGCGPPPARSTCCFEDDDCSATATPERCYGSSGCDSIDGVCLRTPPAGDCFTARDCPPGHRCAGATVVACEPTMAVAGRCEPRPEGLR